ncbi:MAG: SDR family oxidoreductase [Alphaproteobacteria bacterium]|nr:SDR family oxidoreductase [Alphaproteobacteria bacterium]
MIKPTVIITGAGIGIGHATALAFGSAGYHVGVTDVLETEGKATVRTIEAAGGSAEFHKVDVTSTDQVNAAVAAFEKKNGAIDAAIANAGIAHKVKLEDMTDDKWRHTLDIDLNGVFRLCRAVAPGMRKRKKGAIVATSSIMGVGYGWHDHVQYNAAKTGVVGLVRGLACDLGADQIRVNGIAPGYIRSAQSLSTVHSLGPAGLEKAADYIPLGRIGEPDDIADVMVFLCSHGARYISGQTIIVDGGLMVGRY